MSKVVLVDFGMVMFKAIFAFERNPRVPAVYTAVTILLGDLIKVGIKEDDLVIVAVDSKLGSWRKDIDPAYKANRKEGRAKHNIDWKQQFKDFGRLVENLEMNTPFHMLTGDRLEADDIIAVACRKFSDKECVIISADQDYEMLFVYDNVKIFSPKSKRYKEKIDPYKLLAKKIQKEVSDNLVSPILTVADFERRNTVVNLMRLPEEIEQQALELLDFLPEKDWDISALPFKSLHSRFENVYRQDKIVSPDKKKSKKRKKSKKKEVGK